jgi:hypothetical protein
VRFRQIVNIGLLAILASGILYLIDFLIFRDGQALLAQLLDGLSFIPISVFIIVVVIEGALARQEKLLLRHKLNMVIGVFFSEVGNDLIHKLLHSYETSSEIARKFSVNGTWTAVDFNDARVYAESMSGKPTGQKIDFIDLKTFLINKRGFLLALLENPNLIEHEKLSDLLWAIFHLTEELTYRKEVANLSGPDLAHIEGDVNRLYGQLLYQWVDYVEHLQSKYPYLFSLTVRMSPFNANPSAIIS